MPFGKALMVVGHHFEFFCIFINNFFENLPLTLLWTSIIIKTIYLGSSVKIIKMAYETAILWIF
jgi:hypothetical protein